ncbi:type II CAAX prenyl endopeptidase Rce1 family protein [Sphingorhabdus sp.]|uniref:CPBP family glutamic-type intramembrane protease n=1 Tax=Sphingorhabdus sp. TaxID=1902408 RepID=UPI003982E83B
MRRPTIGAADTKWSPLIWRQILLLFLFNLLLFIPLIFFNISYEELLIAFELDVPEHNGFDNYDSLWTFWLAAGIVAPIVEELIFRGWLRGTPRQISMLVSIVAAVILLVVFAEPIRDLPLSARRFLLFAILAGIVGLYLEIFFRTRANAKPIWFFERYFPFIFWTVAAVFGLLHMTNYEGGALLTTVPMVLPQLLAGPLLAFARLRFGLRASILLHSALNSSVVLIAAIAVWLES